MDVFIHDTAIIDAGSEIGKNTKIWHFSHVMSGAKVGENCNIGQNVMIANGAVIGNNVKIQNNVSIYDGVILEDDVFVGPSVVFTNVKNPRSFISRKHEFKPTRVAKGATIGANTTIICGNLIGAYAMIGAGAVITKDVKPYALMVGNPAMQIGWVSEAGVKLDLDQSNCGVCLETGEKYRLENNQIMKLY